MRGDSRGAKVIRQVRAPSKRRAPASSDCLLKETSNGEIWQQAATYLLLVHGGAAMLTLMLLGALFLVHIGRAWRAKKNRATGIVMLAFNAMLIATAFGLYYLASEILRPWARDLHIAFGLATPLLFLAHIKTGRKRA
jgi:hypothetical protein